MRLVAHSGQFPGNMPASKVVDSFMRYRSWPPAPVTGIVFTLSAVAGLCSCAVGPDFHAPAAPDTDHYVAGAPFQTVGSAGADAPPQILISEQDIPAQWWSLFHSAPMDTLVRTALQDS